MKKELREIANKYQINIGEGLERIDEYKSKVVTKLFEEETVNAIIELESKNKQIEELQTMLQETKNYGIDTVIKRIKEELDSKILELVMKSKYDEVKEIAEDVGVLNSIEINTKQAVKQIEPIKLEEESEVKHIEIKETKVDSDKSGIIKAYEEFKNTKETKKEVEEVKQEGKEYIVINLYSEAEKITGINVPYFENGVRAVYCKENNAIVIGKYTKRCNSIEIMTGSLIPKKNIFNNLNKESRDLFGRLRENGILSAYGDYFKVEREISGIELDKITNLIVGKEVDETKVWLNGLEREIARIG